jgi:hypothetical protein
MPKHKYSSVSTFATLSLLVIFSFSLLHHEWWQAAGCVAGFLLLANLPYILKGKMWPGPLI